MLDGWRRAQTTAQASPRLVASWKRTAARLALGEIVGLALEAWRGDRQAALRAAPGVLVTWGVTQGDTYLHLGMNAQARAAPSWDTLGLPVTLTLLRRTVAGFLWAHLLGGRPVRDRLILGMLLGIGATSDVLDGAVARRQQRVTRLGAYLDAEADGSFWLALGLTFAAQRVLPRWFFALLCVRFGAPVLAAALSYSVLRRSPSVGSTIIGKAAAVAQLAVFSAALLSSRRPAPRVAVQRAYWLLQGTTAALLLAAPCAQVVRLFASPPPDMP
jgi:phosphatidylglycerophosphate synthase